MNEYTVNDQMMHDIKSSGIHGISYIVPENDKTFVNEDHRKAFNK